MKSILDRKNQYKVKDNLNNGNKYKSVYQTGIILPDWYAPDGWKVIIEKKK